MKEMIIIIRPEKLEKVKQIFDEAGLGGIVCFLNSILLYSIYRKHSVFWKIVSWCS